MCSVRSRLARGSPTCLPYFDDDVLSRRLRAGLGPIALPLRVAVLTHLRGGRSTSLDRLARLVGSNVPALTRSTLRPLAEAGALELTGRSARASGMWVPVAKTITAVELKLSNWRRAARQADNAAWGADRSWVVLDRHRSRAAVAIGFAMLDSHGTLRILDRPQRRRRVPWLRVWLGELAWARVAELAAAESSRCLDERSPDIEKPGLRPLASNAR
jgi:hypothetical protein